MLRRKLPVLLFLALFASAVPPADRAGAAEFDIDSGRTILRRLQLCLDCGAALLVTDIQTGAMVRCPDCGREQSRLPDHYLITQVYQICKLCLAPLDPHGHAPGDVVECDNCRTRQPLSRDAFPNPAVTQGKGFVPGFPPGSSKKALLFSPNRPDAPITPVPLEEVSATGEPPLPVLDHSLRTIPRPPREDRAGLSDTPPIPPEPTPTPVVATAPATPPASVPEPALSFSGAVEVPSVTADLFGGKRAAAGAEGGAFSSTGRVLARVDGTPIYEAEVNRVAEPVLRQVRERAGPGEEARVAESETALRREVLERLIDRELAVREAAAIGHLPDPAAVREREGELAHILAGSGVDIRREAVRDAVMADMRRRYAEKPGSANPETVREFYRQHKDRMIRPRMLALDQLVVYQERTGRRDSRDYREIALEVSQGLERGTTFAQMREQYDEFAAASGIPHAEPALQPLAAYSAQILQSAGDLRQGAVFGPLFLEGMALFGKVADERPEGPVPFEEAEKEIRRRLENEAAEKNLDAWLKRLRQKANIVYL